MLYVSSILRFKIMSFYFRSSIQHWAFYGSLFHRKNLFSIRNPFMHFFLLSLIKCTLYRVLFIFIPFVFFIIVTTFQQGIKIVVIVFHPFMQLKDYHPPSILFSIAFRIINQHKNRTCHRWDILFYHYHSCTYYFIRIRTFKFFSRVMFPPRRETYSIIG